MFLAIRAFFGAANMVDSSGIRTTKGQQNNTPLRRGTPPAPRIMRT